MSITPNNFLVPVQTYQRSGVASLVNQSCHVATFNTRFRNFDQIQANLGSSILFDEFPLAATSAGVEANFFPAAQRVNTLTVDQANTSSFAIDAQQLIFNLQKGSDDYIKVFSKSFMQSLGATIEANVAKNWISGVTSMAPATLGQLNTQSGPYRFFGDGVTPLTSYKQLAQANVLARDRGATQAMLRAYLPHTIVPDIVNSGLNQFTIDRGNDDARDWMIGDFDDTEYYRSNLMPTHVSGNTGVNANTLTVVSVNDPTGQNVTMVTVSGASNSDASAIFAGDLFKFQDVSGFSALRFLTWFGGVTSSTPVQVRAISNASSDSSGNVVLSFTPALNWAGGIQKNINAPIVAGMQLTGLPSHRAGGIVQDDAAFLAMPQLPEQTPFPSSNEVDPDTGVSLLAYYGTLFGTTKQGLIFTGIHGANIMANYSVRLIVPMTQ